MQTPLTSSRSRGRGLVLLLLALVVPALQMQSSSSNTLATTTTTTTTSTSTATTIRLRGNRLRRPELCRENLPRRPEDLPALVAVGRVREVYLAAGDPQQPAGAADQLTGSNVNRALVTLGRVIKGNQQLVGAEILVSGFNSSSAQPCPNYVKPNDTLILLLELEGERKYAIQGSNLLSLSLANLDRVNALAAGEPQRRRPPIEDVLCEARYCPYGRCEVLSERTGETACRCPDSCPPAAPLAAALCGSDNSTYPTECHLIREGCKLKRPLFVTKEAAC